MYRQGDVLIIQTTKRLPTTAKEIATGIVVYGEATGHAHRLVGGKVLRDGDRMFLHVPRSGKLVHDEHHTITLPKGNYMVVRQREYAGKDMVKVIVD